MIHWHTQSCGINTNQKGNIDFTLPELSATQILMCNCHVDKSTVGRYDMILGIYLLKSIVLNLKLFEHVIKVDYLFLKGSTEPMVGMGIYGFRYLNADKLQLNNFL